MKTEKIWGVTELIHKTPFTEMHHLSIIPNAWCSIHKHQYKHNLFYVLSGELYIGIFTDDGAIKDVIRLGMGERLVIQPNVKHKFATHSQPCECIEIYYPEPLSEDIVRADVGGKVT